MNLPGKIFVTLAVCGVCLAQLSAETARWNYRGFTVSRAGEKIDVSLQHAVAEQIDIVNSVGLDHEFIEFFQSIPLLVVPAGTISNGNPGLYIREDRTVKLTSRIASVGHKPVLLHELLHAYHDQKLAGGFGNPAVLKLYQDAKAKGIFNLKSHMMQNPAEFFACAGTTFLFGVTAQEPFRRESLNNQLELTQFLRRAFGPTCGRYEGSLSNYVPHQSADPTIMLVIKLLAVHEPRPARLRII